jgi:general secretion pathway protein D
MARSHLSIIVLLLALLLAGCATEQARKDALAMLDQGRYEEGLAKLEQAAKEYPDDLSFRTALRNNREMAINRLLAAADTDLAAARPDAARACYERVLGLDAKNNAAKTGLRNIERDQRHAALINEARAMLKKGNTDGAKAAMQQVLLENPDNPGVLELQRQVNDQATKALLAEPTLMAKFKKPINLQFRDANLKMVFEALARTSGINILLDKDVRPDLKTSLFVKDVSVEDTIDLILMQNQLDKKVLSDNTVFVYPNTPAKQKDFQDLKIRSFHLVNADAKQMQTMLKTILKTKDIFVHEKTNSIVIRDTADAVRLAEKMIADQDGADPEVMLEVEVLEVTRSSLTNIGITFPDQLTLTATGASAGSSGSASAVTLRDLRQINESKILTSPALAVGFNLHMDHGDVNILASPRIRVRNKEKAKIMIGDRVPVLTNAVTPVSTGTPVVTGNVQYLDVGLKVEVEPTINSDMEVAIKVNLDVSSIVSQITNSQSGTVAYDIGTRNAATVLSLKDGETQVLAGLINDQDKHTANEVPLLGQVPILGRLFSSHKNDVTKSEIVLSITPHIVRPARRPEASEVEYWSGTEATVRGAPVGLKPMGAIALSSSGGAAAPTQSRIPPRPAPAFPPPPAPATPAATPVPGATADPMNLSWSGPTEAKVGDRISLTLSTASPQAIRSLGFQVGYDASVLKALDVREGSLLKKTDPAASFTRDIQQEQGQVQVELSSQARGGVSAAGTVITVVFEVLAPSPQTQVTVSGITPSGVAGEPLAAVAPTPFTVVTLAP